MVSRPIRFSENQEKQINQDINKSLSRLKGYYAEAIIQEYFGLTYCSKCYTVPKEYAESVERHIREMRRIIHDRRYPKLDTIEKDLRNIFSDRVGLPDYIIIRRQWMPFFVEVKWGNTSLSNEQKNKIAEIEELGFHVYVARIREGINIVMPEKFSIENHKNMKMDK